ncbi:MAG: hypothetical protein IKO05_07250 [Selenomonadaceae bacterium]|nr:hypothetical protein [Selenomonadaceae bacterium]
MSKIFDTEKVQRMTDLLEKLPEKFDNVYIVHEGILIREAAALFKRLKIPVRAIMADDAPVKEFLGLPVVGTAKAKFNERTILIVLPKKPVPFIQTTLDIRNRGGVWTVPALVMTNKEAQAVYNRVMLKNFLELYEEDGFSEPKKNLAELLENFSCGLTTMLHPHYQNFKYQLWDSRDYFKPTYTFDDTGVVIQGPITYDNNYTAETFKLYRAIYPNVPIVVSTWQGEATDDFRRECRENSVVLLENAPPEVAGAWNINMQLKSSLQGVRYLQENTSVKFALKTRTDQRINRFEFLVYFKNLLETFPPKDDKLHRRIIFLTADLTATFPFYFCDYLSFGHIADISKLYDIPFHKGSDELAYSFKNTKRLERTLYLTTDKRFLFDYDFHDYPAHKLRKFNHIMCRLRNPEVYIARNFHEKYIGPIDNSRSFEMSWEFTRDYLILVDYSAILFDWIKYENRRYACEHNTNKGKLVFARWLDIYRNFKID